MLTHSRWALAIFTTIALAGCRAIDQPTLTFSGSAVGREADVIRRQLDGFARAHPPLKVTLRATPDAADQRHQLYVQWLNARVSDPDVLQLDVVWTPEFAAAGWIAMGLNVAGKEIHRHTVAMRSNLLRARRSVRNEV